VLRKPCRSYPSQGPWNFIEEKCRFRNKVFISHTLNICSVEEEAMCIRNIAIVTKLAGITI
jgi:hypothetical protein